MTVGVRSLGPVTDYGYFAAQNLGSLDDTTIDVVTPPIIVSRVLNSVHLGSISEIRVVLDAFIPYGSVFNLGGTEYTVNSDSELDEEELGLIGHYQWSAPEDLAWSSGQEVTVSLKLAPGLSTATVNGHVAGADLFRGARHGFGSGGERLLGEGGWRHGRGALGAWPSTVRRSR